VLRHAHAGVFVFRKDCVNRLLPKRLAAIAIKADEMTLKVIHLTGILTVYSVAGVTRHEHFVANNNWARNPRSGKLHLPLEVFLLSKSRRQRF